MFHFHSGITGVYYTPGFSLTRCGMGLNRAHISYKPGNEIALKLL